MNNGQEVAGVDRSHNRSWFRALGPAVVIGLLLAGCSSTSDEGTSAKGSVKSDSIVLVTYDSFALPKEAAKQFEKQTGAKIEVLAGGDSSTVLTRSLLSAGSPEGDVIFGVDNMIASRALSADLLESYRPEGSKRVDPRLLLKGEASKKLVPIDHGDVCLNYDRKYFVDHNIAEPRTLEQLTEPAYKNLTVLESPVTSSPGLAFLMGTVAHFGATGWEHYWQELKANGVKVRQSWDDAYYSDYSVSGGDRPIVLSYASSPPVEVVFAEDGRTEPSSRVMVDTCVSQVEYAGILKGTKKLALAKKLIDFMISDSWQKELPLSNYVYPAVDVELPEVFREWSPEVNDPLSLSPDDIDSHRDEWIESWRKIME